MRGPEAEIIANKYNIEASLVNDISPEIEGYVEK